MDMDSRYMLFAVRGGRLETVSALIDHYGLSYLQAWSEGYVLLREAVESGHREIVKLLLIKGSKVNNKSKKPSNNPLHLASENGDIEIVKMLLDSGADINAKNKYGYTPLYNAITNMKVEIAMLLLMKKAYGNTVTIDGLVPLHPIENLWDELDRKIRKNQLHR